MLKLRLFPPHPTTSTFKTANEASEFALDQARKWRDFMSPRRLSSPDSFPSIWPADRWNDFAGFAAEPKFEDRSNWPELQDQAERMDLVHFEGDLGLALQEIAERFGNQALDGALRGVFARSHASPAKFLDGSQLLGIALAADVMSVGAHKSTAVATKSFRAKIEEFETATVKQREAADAIEQKLIELLNKMTAESKSQLAEYEDWRERTKGELSEQFNQWENEWAAVKLAFEEELRLKAPITFWTSRAKAHRAAARARARQLAGWGSLGAGVAVGLAALLFDRLLFDRSMADMAGALERGAIAGTGALFFATIYLWAMRVLTRFFVSEHHLAIDAQARASMAYTYLSLVKKGAVDEKDRAIILDALFRPVSDGMVRDDAMPNFTPAAILSAGAVRGQ
jgi:Family of unknown function (DUF6161)